MSSIISRRFHPFYPPVLGRVVASLRRSALVAAVVGAAAVTHVNAQADAPGQTDEESGEAVVALVVQDPNSNHSVRTISELTGNGHISIPGNTTLRLDNPVANVFNGRLTGNGTLEKVGTGDLTFSSISNTNTFHFAGTVALTTGTLEFEGGSAHHSLTLGTLQLTGGTLLLDSSFINVTTLNITANTILDFGTGGGSVLNATNIYIAEGATLTVKNWTSEVDFLFATSTFRLDDRGGVSAEFNATGSAPQNQIVFEGASGGGSAWINYDYNGYTNFEIRPIPEPSTYGLIITGLSLGIAGWHRRRQMRRQSRQLS